ITMKEPFFFRFRISSAARAYVRECRGRQFAALDFVHLRKRRRERHGDSRACGRDVLERRCSHEPGREPRRAHELPGVQRIEDVDEARHAVEHLNRRLRRIERLDRGVPLMRIAAVLELQRVDSVHLSLMFPRLRRLLGGSEISIFSVERTPSNCLLSSSDVARTAYVVDMRLCARIRDANLINAGPFADSGMADLYASTEEIETTSFVARAPPSSIELTPGRISSI